MKFSDIWRSDLAWLSSNHPLRGACMMQVVAYIEYGVMSDRPPCVAGDIRNFCVTLNDEFEDDERQQLKQFIPQVVGTDSTSLEARDRLRRRHIRKVIVPQYFKLAKDPVDFFLTAPARLMLLGLLHLRRWVWGLSWTEFHAGLFVTALQWAKHEGRTEIREAMVSSLLELLDDILALPKGGSDMNLTQAKLRAQAFDAERARLMTATAKRQEKQDRVELPLAA